METLGSYLSAHRRSLVDPATGVPYTSGGFAKLVGVSAVRWSLIENDRVRPSVKFLCALASNVSLDQRELLRLQKKSARLPSAVLGVDRVLSGGERALRVFLKNPRLPSAECEYARRALANVRSVYRLEQA